MDIRIVESMGTSGVLADAGLRVDSNIENVSLVWTEADRTLTLVDYNVDYASLPEQLGTGLFKKTFLTYNGKDCQTGKMLETVLIESASEEDANHLPGYMNSNEWVYNPKNFNYLPEFKEFTDIKDYNNMPYDYSQGFTVVKQFLTSGGSLVPTAQSPYTAFYRVPTLTSFLPSNVENNKIYTDGWYTSYVIACKQLTYAPLIIPAKGDIFYYVPQRRFYINLTGQIGDVITETIGAVTVTKPDPVHWGSDVNFTDWTNFLRTYNYESLAGEKVYYVETQHLVTAELNEAIKEELKRQCSCCDKPDFNVSNIELYMKLMQKRMGAYLLFNEESFHEAQCVVESSRQICSLCLYNQSIGKCC
jgi:hypothetical protein